MANVRKYQKYEPGMKFGELTLVKRLPGGQKWLCQCGCGNMVSTQISGGSRSCNQCATKRRGNTKHGHNKNGKPDRVYRIWIGMKSRCHNPNDTGYRHYGERGVSVCDEWKDDFQSFYDWAISHGYEEHLTVDRINVNGDYTPDNCRWIPMIEQAKNRRKTEYKYGRDNMGRFKKKSEE